jgi:hypothetical protein
VNRVPPVLCPSVLAFYSIIGFSSLSKHLHPHRTRSSGPSDLQEGRDCTRNEIYDKSDDDLVNTPICLRWLKSGCGVCIDTAFVGSGLLAKVSFQPPRQWLTVLHSQSSRLVWCASPLFGVTLMVCPNGQTVPPSAGYLITPSNQGFQAPGLARLRRVPSLRRRSVGPPPSAIHGGGRLSRHPCRSAHSASPAFSLHPSRVLWCLGFLGMKIKSHSAFCAA